MSEAGAARGGVCPVCGVPLGGSLAPRERTSSDPGLWPFETGEIQSCPRCETQHHADCWDWAGGCAIYGCAALPVVARAQPGAGLLEERPPALPPDRLAIQAALTRGWMDPVPGPVAPYWWTLATLLAPLGGIGFLVVPAVPFLLSRVRWRFDGERRVFEYSVTVAGVPVSTRTIPLDDVVRLEVRDDEVNIRLVLVLKDGTSLELAPDGASDPTAWLRLRALARGVQQHTGLHVTSALRLDPTTCEKRLVALKAGFAQVESRARFLSRVSGAGAAALAAVMVLGGPLPAALPALALLAAGHLGRRAIESVTADDSPFLRHGLVRPSALSELERQVQALAVTKTSAVAYAVGSAALVAAAWAWSGTMAAPIAFLLAAIGSTVNAARWAGARPLARLLDRAEMGRDEQPADAVSAQIGEAANTVRSAIVKRDVDTRISTLRWELACRKRMGFHAFLGIVSAMAYVLAHATPGSAAKLVELFAGVTALYSAFIGANLARWTMSRSQEAAEEELEERLGEKRALLRGQAAPRLEGKSVEKVSDDADPGRERG